MAAGGSISSLSIGGNDFSVASDCDVGLRIGGLKPTTHRNGDGTTRVTGEQEDWALNDIDVSVDASSGQLQFLQSVANQLEPVNCTITLIDGTIYQGSGLPVSDRDFSTAKSVMRLSLMGSGQLTKQEPPLLGGIIGKIAGALGL